MFRSILAAGLGLLMLAAVSPVLGGEREDIVELQKLTGLDTLFDGLGEQWGAAGATDLKDDQVREAWRRAAAGAFVADTMREEAVSGLEGGMTEADRAALLAFYRTDFAGRLLGAENAAKGNESIVEDGKAILASATPERLALLRALAEATGYEIAEQLFIDSLHTMMLAEVLAVAHGESPVPWDEINEKIDAQLKLIAPTMQKQIREFDEATIAFTYRDITDDELEEYVDFLRTAPAQRFYSIMVQGIAQATDHAMANLGTSFVRNLLAIGI
jgi:hypothetical protein